MRSVKLKTEASCSHIDNVTYSTPGGHSEMSTLILVTLYSSDKRD